MSRSYDLSDFSALMERAANYRPLGRSGRTIIRERNDARPDREDVIQERLANRYRKTHQIRDQNYALRESEIFTLKELGKFRVISFEHLSRFGYDENRARLEQDLQHLKNRGLVSDRRIDTAEKPNSRVLALTKEGKQFLRHQNLVPKDQALYDGFRKPKELAHDAGLYRLYQRIATEIEINGGSVRRVILDYELKEQLYRDLNRASAQASEQHRASVAARHGLKVVDGSIPIPDLRVEYENDAKEIERIDLELATREYRSQGLAAKARAGFRLYARHQDVDRLRRVMDQQEITARIFAL
ncbi:MAG TPA: hypothetical protein VJN93_02120 [Candidatus Acidoferrum sp.]|nr:hypothetical protein [Candidatus Acidoferrum sp.]